MDHVDFSQEEQERYSRHLILPEFGIEGQRKLKKAKVLIVGAGGLGCPMLLYLTAAGVGTIGIVDYDVVDHSNLQRQVLFSTEDIGKSKAEVAAYKLAKTNPHLKFDVHNVKLNSENALDILKNYDIVADGTDNFPTRYLVNDACVILRKTNVHGSIFRFEGQVSVFNYQYDDGSIGVNYRDIFPSPPSPGLVPNCAEGGVLGILPGIIGSFQANEIIKVIAGIGETLDGKLLIFDALSMESRTMKIRKNVELPAITHLIDYEDFCGLSSLPHHETNQISVQELKNLISRQQDIQLIDVREPFEFQQGNIGGHSIPLGTILENQKKIDKELKKIILCRSGMRSKKAIEILRSSGFKNLYNLEGGLLEWKKEIDRNFTIN